MYYIKYNNMIVEKFTTKIAAKNSLADRESLCYILKCNLFSYSIVKGKSNVRTRSRKKRSVF